MNKAKQKLERFYPKLGDMFLVIETFYPLDCEERVLKIDKEDVFMFLEEVSFNTNKRKKCYSIKTNQLFYTNIFNFGRPNAKHYAQLIEISETEH